MNISITPFLRDPKARTRSQVDAIKLVRDKVKAHLTPSLRNAEGNLVVSLFMETPTVPDDFKQLNETVYIKDITGGKLPDWLAFTTTLTSWLRRYEAPQSVAKLAIVLSLRPVSEEEIFAINKEKDVSTVRFEALDPVFQLEDVVMNDDERAALLRALTIITERELIFDRWGFRKTDRSTKSVLCFHGAAGTGKTMCAHAVASYLGKKLLIGSYNQIQSKFVGEGEKNLVAYFKAAEEQDAVLFIDEADTFLSRRLPSSNENSKHYNSMSNELYQQIEQFNGCIVFASNLIRDFDPAVLSRIIEPIEFKLPDKRTRVAIISKLLPATAPIHLTDDELDQLAEDTAGFSGRDIRKAILIFFAEGAYKHRVLANEERAHIELTYQEMASAFRSVRQAKENLRKGVAGMSIPARVAEENRRATRLLHTAAIILWADGKVDERERKLFRELSTQLGVDIDLNDRDKLPTLEQLTGAVLSQADKTQMLDIACRMAAIDDAYPPCESQLIERLALLLGFNMEKIAELHDYVRRLQKGYADWNQLVEGFHTAEYTLLLNLKKEYSEGAAWCRLGTAYAQGGKVGDTDIVPDAERAKDCLKKAVALGYDVDKKLLESLGINQESTPQ